MLTLRINQPELLWDDPGTGGSSGYGGKLSADLWPPMLWYPKSSSQQSCRSAAGSEDYLSTTADVKTSLRCRRTAVFSAEAEKQVDRVTFIKVDAGGRGRPGGRVVCRLSSKVVSGVHDSSGFHQQLDHVHHVDSSCMMQSRLVERHWIHVGT